jgi:glycosyltransferase involved in cell wall biosynthesis
MKIIVNAIPMLSPLTGVGQYLKNIVLNLKKIDSENTYMYYYGVKISKKFPVEQKELMPSFYKNLRVYYDLLLKKFVSEQLRYSFERSIKYLLKFYVRQFLSYYTRKRLYDLYFEPNFIPLDEIKAKKVVATVFDFSFYLYPQWHPKDRIKFFSKYFWKNINRVDKIITISNFVKQQAEQLLKFDKERISVVYLGYNKDNFRCLDNQLIEEYLKQKNLPKKFILFVGSVEPRKNLKNLLLAYSVLPKSLTDEVKLVIAGFHGWKNKEIMSLLMKLKKNVFYLGYVSDEELAILYNSAVVFIYPSFYEGFGLPNIEAMACGCPVITSDIPVMKEICGDAACYVNPYEMESIKDGIIKVLEDKDFRNELVQKGFQRIKNFSWEKSASEHLKIFESLV